jgi:hypothetical protein
MRVVGCDGLYFSACAPGAATTDLRREALPVDPQVAERSEDGYAGYAVAGGELGALGVSCICNAIHCMAGPVITTTAQRHHG